MKLVFCKGTFRGSTGDRVASTWAETPSGIVALPQDGSSGVVRIGASSVLESDPVVTMDLPGLDEQAMDVVVENVLRRGYLDKPGIRGKDEAVFFVLVNEVLTELEGIRQETERDDAG